MGNLKYFGNGGGNSTLHAMNADTEPAKLSPAALAPPTASAGGPSDTWNVSTGSVLESRSVLTSTGLAVSPGAKLRTSSAAS